MLRLVSSLERVIVGIKMYVSIQQCLLRNCHVLDTILGNGIMALNKEHRILVLGSLQRKTNAK